MADALRINLETEFLRIDEKTYEHMQASWAYDQHSAIFSPGISKDSLAHTHGNIDKHSLQLSGMSNLVVSPFLVLLLIEPG